MIDKALWAKNSYAPHAKTTNVDGVEMVSFPLSTNNDEHLKLATKLLLELGCKASRKDESNYESNYRQVIGDIRVVDLLKTNGADLSIATEIEHWAYFKTVKKAFKYAVLVQRTGFKVMQIGKSKNDKEILVKFSHIGTLEHQDISSKTLKLGNVAEGFGGNYDGWEVTVDRSGNLVPAKQLEAQ